MARFRLFLIGSPQPLEVDLPASDAIELGEIASRTRFLDGHLSDADGHGVCAGVLIPTCRVQLIIEAN